jgi:hypothetical protein
VYGTISCETYNTLFFPINKILVCKNIEKKAKHQSFSLSFVAIKYNFTTDR